MTDVETFSEFVGRAIAGNSVAAMLNTASIDSSGGIITWIGQCVMEDEATLVEEWLIASGYKFTHHPAHQGEKYAIVPDDRAKAAEIQGAVRAALTMIYLWDIQAEQED
jgi:hypothetical protein